MKTYTCPRDLEQFGFRCLTGEACGLSIRLLYDMNRKGHSLLARSLGMTPEQIIPNPPWNGGEFADGSVLLTNEQATLCALLGMLVYLGCVEVWQPYDKDGRLLNELYGLVNDEEIELAKKFRIGHPVGTEFRKHRLSSMPGSGDQHTHEMSGRIR